MRTWPRTDSGARGKVPSERSRGRRRKRHRRGLSGRAGRDRVREGRPRRPPGERPFRPGASRTAGERGGELRPRCPELLGNRPRPAEDRQEVRVAVPAGDDVQMRMVRDARARAAADVETLVEAVGPIRRGQDRLGGRGEVEELVTLVRGHREERGAVRERSEHQVPVRVGVPVQSGEHRLTPVHDEAFLVRAARKNAEQAPLHGLPATRKIRRAPRREKRLHQPGPGPGVRVPGTPGAAEEAEATGVTWLMSSFSLLPGLKYGTRFGGTMTFTPLRLGLRAIRAPLCRNRKLPNPLSSIFSPDRSEAMIPSNTESTMISACFFVRLVAWATCSTRSAFVVVPSARPTTERRRSIRPPPVRPKAGAPSTSIPKVPSGVR